MHPLGPFDLRVPAPPTRVTEPGPPAKPKAAVLSRKHFELLIELSVAVHRYAMYPPGHPSLTAASENVVSRLSELFETQRGLTIGVGRGQLIVEGVPTDPNHPVLSELALRLAGHQLGAISFARGTDVHEVGGMLQILAEESDFEDEPVGMLPLERLPSWDHARIYPVEYDHLELREELGYDPAETDRATQLWLGLAQAAMDSDEALDPAAAPGPNTLARIIEKHPRDPGYDEVIADYLLQLADELKSGRDGEAEKVRQWVSTLLKELGGSTLSRLMEMGGSEKQRRRFILDANQGLAVDAVVKVLQATAEASAQSISHSMTGLLSKLAVHSGKGSEHMRAQADMALRENVDELIADWKLADPNPGSYTAMLDAMARSSPLFQAHVGRQEGRFSGPFRIVRLAVAVDAWGPTVQTAVGDLLAIGQAPSLIQLVESAPEDSRTAEQVLRDLTSPSQLKKVLASVDVNEDTLQMLTERMGTAAIPVLLDVLTDSDSRSVRRKVFDRLIQMGPQVGECAVEKLADGRWFVLRNMLVLLRRLDVLPVGFDPRTLLDHPDQRVRRESIPLALRKGEGRERVLAAALGDTDERTVRMALLELHDDLPETLVPVLVNRVIKSERSAEIRALAARKLGNSHSPLALDVLLGLSTGGRTLLGKPRLAGKSAEVLAALQTLAHAWAADARAAEVLALAARSKDPDVRRAVVGERGDV